MYRYVLKRLKDTIELGVNVRKSFACQQKINSNVPQNENKQSQSVLRFQEIQFLTHDQKRINYEDFRKKYNCKHPNNCNPFLQAITWSTALIAGFYASQVLCLYRRNHRLDPKTCFYARYFQQKSRFLHRKLLCVQQAREKRNNVVPASLKYGCPFKKKQTEQKTSNNQPKNDTQRNDDFKEHHRVVNQFASLNFFDKRYEPFIKVDDYKSPYFNVSNDKPEKSQEKNVDSKVSQLSKENQQTTEQQEFVEDEAIDDILSNLSKMIGELEFKLGVECVLRGNYNEAVEHFRMSSASNNPSACFNLALLYEQGLGVKKDLRIAMELYKVASEQGHDKSQYNLGVYFARGLGGVKKNFKQAKLYFEKAAMHGNRDAIEALSMILPKKKKLSSLLVDPEDFIVSDDSGTDMVIQDSVNKHASLRRLAVT